METKKISYTLFKWLLGVPFLIYYRPKFKNKNVIPKDGPIIMCGNHVHLFDQCLPIMATKRMLHYMAKKEYFDSKLAWFFKAGGCISVNRSIKDEKAKDAAMNLLKNGYAVGLFPEGTRNNKPGPKVLLLPFKFGAVSMAQKSGATIVPFGISGKYKFWHNKLTINFGTPFKVPQNMSLEDANQKLYNEIKNKIENVD